MIDVWGNVGGAERKNVERYVSQCDKEAGAQFRGESGRYFRKHMQGI